MRLSSVVILSSCLLLIVLPMSLTLAGQTDKSSVQHPVAGVGDVSVTKSDNNSLVFEYRPQFTAVREIQQDEKRFLLYDFSGAIPVDVNKNLGAPDIRFRNFPIALPGEKGTTLQVISADYEDIQGILIAPIPTARMRDSMMDIGQYAMSREAYARSSFQPGSIAELVPMGAARSLLLGAVHVYPLQYNPQTRTLRKYSRIVLQISYGPRTTHPGVNMDEVPYGNVLLNHNMAASWKIVGSPAAVHSSVLASGTWYRIVVSDEGIYRLNAAYLTSAGIDVSTLDPRTIKVYGNGGMPLDESVNLPRPTDLVENAIFVQGESDGKFDAGDYVVFYARSPRGWIYDANDRTLRHYINLYSELNYYWLTFGGSNGKRMVQQPSLNSGTSYAPDKFLEGIAVEKEAENIVQSGKDWFGQRIEPNSSFTLLTQLPGLFPNDQITYRYRLEATSNATPVLTVSERSSSTILGTYTLGSTNDSRLGDAGTWQSSGPSTLTNNSAQLKIEFQTADVGPTTEARIDWVEFLYPRMFWATGNILHFRSPDTTAVVEFRMQQFTETPWIFNVTSFSDVRLVTGLTGAYTFQSIESAGAPSEYWAIAPSAWKTPAAAEHVVNQDLRGFAAGAEFIIITSREFRTAADRLAAFRRGQGITSVVVDVNQIYNEFGGGLPDITAIRDYLRYTYANWTQRPRYVLLFGQASYDYKGILGSKSSYVPTWQSSESLDDVQSYSTDDFFVQFGGGTAPSLVLGRIASRSPDEARTVVDKIIRYDNSSVRDNWKLRIVYVGDDAWNPDDHNNGYSEGTIHSGEAEMLAEEHTPELFEKKKIYIAEYPTEYAAQGRRKPGAYQAIIDNINQGTLLFSFAGHGNPTQLAHENIFNVATSIPQLVNSDRLAVFLMATCNFSQIDDPVRESGGELLMNKTDGGAVAVMAATRKVHPDENSNLANSIYDFMFQHDTYGRVSVLRPAEAMFLSKTTRNDMGQQKFFFLGDPTMRLRAPDGFASIDSIDEQPLDSLNGSPVTNPVTIRALARVTIAGSIRGNHNATDSLFNGKLTLLVNDPTRKHTIVNFAPGINWTYEATGGMIFRGDNSITNGRFRGSFVVPRDVSFSDSTSRGRMLVYFSNDAIDGAGFTNNFRIGPPNTVNTTDHEGPGITIYLDTRSFRQGDLVSEKPTLIVDLEDTSGINTSASGIGHRIETWINNAPQSIDVTDAYTSKLDSYTEGSVQYQLRNLPTGKNTLKVRAWDSFNNSASKETFFEVGSSDQLILTDVMNWPNPFRNETVFTFRQNQLALLNITVKIYTVAGRLIQTLATTSAGESFVRVPWDGRDRDGDLVANGVYFYKVLVTTVDGLFSSEALAKLAVVR